MKLVNEMSTLKYSLMLVMVTFVLVEAKVPMTFTVDGGDSRPVTSHQNLTTCSGVYVELSVCVPTARPGSLLSLKVKGQTTLSSHTCVRDIERFSSSQTVIFSYDEEEFVFHVKVDACVVSRKRRSSTWRSISPVTLLNTASSTTCGDRHPVTINDGIEVLCDTATEGGEWVIIQRRTVGDVDFYRSWGPYVAGFGEVTGDHWLGLKHIHVLCPPSRPCRLRVDMKDPNYRSGKLFWAEYSSFSLTGSSDNYRLSISGYDSSSTVRDSLAYHNGMAFSTKDRDNDKAIGDDYNCATRFHGAWWYKACAQADLNGRYGARDATGSTWYTADGYFYLYATYTEMKIRVFG